VKTAPGGREIFITLKLEKVKTIHKGLTKPENEKKSHFGRSDEVWQEHLKPAG